ncbi:MAG: WD40 repeat domain-containing protein, partial [Bdellovibrio bacteriovorus]
WDAGTGEPLGRPLEHADAVYGARFNADGTRVLTRSGDGTAREWDGVTGEPLDPPLTHGAAVRGVLFSPDERRILTWGDDGSAQVWDAVTHLPATPPLRHGDPVQDARFSADGTLVLSWSLEGGPRVWDAEDGSELSMPTGGGKGDERDQIAGADFSGDGAAVLTWWGDERARLASPLTREVLRELVHPSRVASGRLEGLDRPRALTWDLDGNVRVWADGAGDRGTRDLTLRHANRVEGARCSDDGTRILTWTGGASGRTGRTRLGSARIWDAGSGLPLTPPLTHRAAVRGVQLSPDGTRLLTWSDDGTAKLWDSGADLGPIPSLATADEVEQLSVTVPPALVVEDGGSLTRILDPEGHISLSAPLADAGPIRGARLSPDGSRLVTWHTDGRARRWDTRTGRELTPPLAHQRPVTGARFSSDGRRILTWSQDGSARVWDAQSGEPLTPGLRHQGPVNGADFSADTSRILTWGNDGTARLWDGETGTALSPPLRHPSEELGSLSAVVAGRLNPEGSRVLTRDETGTARAWDLSLGSDWPIGALGLGLEAETGTALAPTGELRVLDPIEWRQVRYCEYERLRHDLGRLSGVAWKDALHRCQDAQADLEHKASSLPDARSGRSGLGG